MSSCHRPSSQTPAMADESNASASTTTINAAAHNPPSTSATATATTSASASTPTSSSNRIIPNNGPLPGLAIRRAATFGQPTPLRRRLSGTNPPPSADNNTFSNLRRRSSTYSDYFETSADELLNPSKSTAKENKKSPFVYVPLTAALLPAVAGIFFENGSAFFTDLILLSIAAIFLHWSVTQPWDWYHSAQQVRVVQDEILSNAVFESDSELESSSASATTALENVPEEKGNEGAEAKDKALPAGRSARWEARQAAAVKELYLHEIVALVWCFIFPMLGAYLLHAIRSQLSQPSGGLVSDYNLTIFLCAAELRPVSHLIRMLQERTLHIQAIVAHNPHTQKIVTNDQIQALYDRLGELEAREPPKESLGKSAQPDVPPKLLESAVGREFRRSIQPELEALNRAMRRYEKKLNLLAGQTDDRIEYVEDRLNDAIALAAVAAKNSSSQWRLTSWLIDGITAVIVLPLQALAAMLTFPFRTASTLFRWKRQPAAERGPARRPRNGKSPALSGSSSDRVPTRVARR
ncbi:hypothetical protein F5Y14DRAFT_412770 [Nemania sp. NC0429]|nr:hypothetical protein F5Y14DRAFT_412770 [Nemania sp. NC0429]